MFSIIFYYIGFILNKTQKLETILSSNSIIFISLIIWMIGIKFNWIELAIRRYPNGAFSILTAICGIIVILRLSQLIEKYLKQFGNILAWYGKNSMFILLLHQVESTFVKYGQILHENNSSIYKMEVSALKIFITTIGTLIINWIKKLVLSCMHKDLRSVK